MRQCENGHFYDEKRYAVCPYCESGAGSSGKSAGGPDIGKTVAAGPEPGADIGRTVAAVPDVGEDAGKTVAFLEEETGFDPVVGYVICVDGPMRGADFRLRAGRNFIGRSAGMNISLADDNAVSREGHAVISYDDRNNHFRVAPGTGRGLTYLNGNEVDNGRELAAYDIVEVGHTKLLFLPLCGAQFTWS